jgi:hypothetical protein
VDFKSSSDVGIPNQDSALGDQGLATSEPPNVISTADETEVDHRGIKLPSRHRAGGIITPQ